MPTIGSITKTIRINAEDLRVFEEIMADGTSWSGAVHQLCSGTHSAPTGIVPEGVSADDWEEIMSMVSFMGGKRTYFHLIREAMTEGRIVYENGKLTLFGDLETEEFKEMCREKGLDPQTVLNKATQSVKRGWL